MWGFVFRGTPALMADDWDDGMYLREIAILEAYIFSSRDI